MKKIISFTAILCLVSLVLLNFIDNDYYIRKIRILSYYDINYKDVFDEYIGEKHIDVIIDTYEKEEELYNLIKHNQYDLIICNKKSVDLLINNRLINKIDKDKILNYRNISSEYQNDNDYYINYLLDNDDMYVMTIKDTSSYNLMEHLLRADINAIVVKNNNLININWASEYYLKN